MVGDEDGTRAVEGDGAGTCGVADAGTVRWGETCGERGWGVGGEGGQESETGRADYFRASGKQRSTDEGQKKKNHPRVGKTRRKQPPFNPSPFSPPPPPPLHPFSPPNQKTKKRKTTRPTHRNASAPHTRYRTAPGPRAGARAAATGCGSGAGGGSRAAGARAGRAGRAWCPEGGGSRRRGRRVGGWGGRR